MGRRDLARTILIDRRRLKRRLNFWRVLAVLAVVGGGRCVAPCPAFGARRPRTSPGVNVTGMITEDRKLIDAVHAPWRKDRSVPAVIVSIDSPGGSVAGGESLHDALMRVAAAKPVVAVMRGTAASAGYMVALPGRPHLRPRRDADRLDRRDPADGRGLRPARQARRHRRRDHLRPAEGPAELHPPADAAGPRVSARAWCATCTTSS